MLGGSARVGYPQSLTVTGTLELVVVLLPSWPKVPSPQQQCGQRFGRGLLTATAHPEREADPHHVPNRALSSSTGIKSVSVGADCSTNRIIVAC